MTQLVWLITGCSSGFGELLTHHILSRGDLVIATARTLSKIAHLSQAGAATLELDVTHPQQAINDTVAQAIAIYGRIDVVVNNAGYVTSGAWEDIEYEQLLAQFDTNVFGVVKVTRAVLPHLREKKSGTMVFISSLSGWCGHPFVGPYAGSKFALEGMVESLSRETEVFGIKTLLVEPGRFRTMLLSPDNLHTAPSKISDYDKASKAHVDGLAQEDRMQPGDTQKAVKIIVDLVRKEGCAEGREVPFRFPLGTDCYESIKEKCEETLHLLKDWNQVINSTDHENHSNSN
ncbi:NAD(P)-binding protein [Annulohypoxylon maeteangense]|uniref:NAD(P)-binding protein n=1 Tax=Annulohypoxylon maeteangense TaxID=1927788 RepID=UPI0020077C05|nr:NAD(P)-binding protein [Annulohypoxylon maeteangense]KAI0888346.1 NAD(P)-binding protein [Annulohypoxylon maeteangense]